MPFATLLQLSEFANIISAVILLASNDAALNPWILGYGRSLKVTYIFVNRVRVADTCYCVQNTPLWADADSFLATFWIIASPRLPVSISGVLECVQFSWQGTRKPFSDQK